MDLKFEGKDGTVALHANNYYKIQFSAMGFVPTGELHPCSDIKGMQARVEFVESTGKAGQITAIELRK